MPLPCESNYGYSHGGGTAWTNRDLLHCFLTNYSGAVNLVGLVQQDGSAEARLHMQFQQVSFLKIRHAMQGL